MIDREILFTTQYNIPSKLTYLVDAYPNVTWKQAVRLYYAAVEVTLAIFDAELLIGIPFGKGYHSVNTLFVDYLNRAEKFREKREK